ncbi:MAG: hypothetical protein AAB664_00855 [Patescibacteria group bacterium]
MSLRGGVIDDEAILVFPEKRLLRSARNDKKMSIVTVFIDILCVMLTLSYEQTRIHAD